MPPGSNDCLTAFPLHANVEVSTSSANRWDAERCENRLLTHSSRHYQCNARLHHRHADSVCTIWREESSLLWRWHIFPLPPIFSGSLQVHPAWSVSSQKSSLIQKERLFPYALPGTAEPPVFLFDMPGSSAVQELFFFQLPESGDSAKKTKFPPVIAIFITLTERFR